MMRIRSFLGMTPGNPMNPIMIILLVFFGAAIFGAPVAMSMVDMGTGGIVLFEVVAIGATLLIMGIVIVMARGFGQDFARLMAGEAWARWRLSSAERSAFLQQEGERTRARARRYLAFAIALMPIGAALTWLFTRDAIGAMLGALVFGAAGMLVVLSTLRWDKTRPKQDADDIDDVYLGDLGIYAFGRFTPLSGVNLALRNVELTNGDPAYLTFTTVSRGQYGDERPRDISVPIASGHGEEAAMLVTRFKERFAIPG